MSKCRECGHKTKPNYTTEDQSRNGVKVIVYRFHDKQGNPTGTSVEANCQCFGSPMRTHSSMGCPVYLRLLEIDKK